MKRYRYVIFGIIIALLLSVTGCAKVQAGSSEPAEEPGTLEETPTIPEEPPVSEATIETEEETAHTLSVEIQEVREEDIEERAYWLHVADEDGIYLAICPDATVYSFKFVVLHVEETESGLQYVIDEEQFSVEELSPDKPFLVKMLFVGLFPTYGFTFEDENHNAHFFTINIAGLGPENGDPLYLTEIE